MRARRNKQEPNYWAAYADCMLALFMIALLLWLLSTGKTIFSSGDDKGTIIDDLRQGIAELEQEIKRKDEEIADLRKTIEALPDGERLADIVDENEKLKKENNTLQTQLEKAVAEMEVLKKRNEKLNAENLKLEQEIADLKEWIDDLGQALNDKPPIIELDEGNPIFRFTPGSASLNDRFRQELNEETFPNLLKTLKKFPKVDTIEIIGHTDGVSISRRGTMDTYLPDILHKGFSLDRLSPGSNADLGLMRALAIRDEWNKWVPDRLPSGQKPALRCYSAAQTIPANGKEGIELLKKKGNDPASRRIEIRVTDLKN